MRIARNLALLAMLALAATALASPLALAQDTEPELHNQTPRLIVQQETHAAGDVNCPAVVPTPPPTPSPIVTSGGCRLHLASLGEIALLGHAVGGVETLAGSCFMEFDVRIDSAGEGWLTHQEFVSQGSCGTTACGQVAPNEGRANSFHMREAEPGARELVTFLLCVADGPSPRHCEYTFTLTQPTVHTYSFNALDVAPHGGFTFDCPEMDGLLRTEAAGPLSGEGQAYQNVEIRHN